MQNDMKNFYRPIESPLKVRNIAVYSFLISFLVPEFTDLKNGRKYGTIDCAVLHKSIKIDTICDVM